MKTARFIAAATLTALLVIPARGEAMSADAKQDLLAYRIAVTACRRIKPGIPELFVSSAVHAQLQVLRRPSYLGAIAMMYYCAHDFSMVRKFADLGTSHHDPLSEWILGGMYYHGVPGAGVAADPTKAFAYFMQSARQGFPLGLVSAGMDLVHGEGTAPNPKKGAALVRLAAMQGNTIAMRDMGEFYLHGIGGPPNSQRAISWLSRAAAAGDSWSRRWLAAHHRPPVEAGAPSSAASVAPQPRAQPESITAAAPAAHAPVDHQQQLRELQQFWTLYFHASHARVVDFGAPALVQPVGFGGAP